MQPSLLYETTKAARSRSQSLYIYFSNVKVVTVMDIVTVTMPYDMVTVTMPYGMVTVTMPYDMVTVTMPHWH
jgi:hypothetical protein